MSVSNKPKGEYGRPAASASVRVLDERLQRVVHLREKEDRTFKEIGADLGVSNEYARQLYQDALAKIEHHAHRHEDPLYGLSVRARHCLRNRFLTDRAEIRAAIVSGDLHPKNRRTRNYGWTTHREVCKWLGLPEPEKP